MNLKDEAKSYVDVASPKLKSFLWAIKLIRFTWLPSIVAIVGQWAISSFQIALASLISFAAIHFGKQVDQEVILPSFVLEWLKNHPQPVQIALLAAIGIVVLIGILNTIVAFMASIVHILLNKKFSPEAISAACSIDNRRLENMDPSTAVQRWLLKSDVVNFLHNGVINTIASIGTIVIIMWAAFKIDANAGVVCFICMIIWVILAIPLTVHAIRASREMARKHETVGRTIRNSVALREELSRPSMVKFWLDRSRSDIQHLNTSIFVQGAWGSTLFGVQGTIAQAMPIIGTLVTVFSGNIYAGLPIYLYLSRISEPLGNISSLLPSIQDQIISIQRIYDFLKNANLHDKHFRKIDIIQKIEARNAAIAFSEQKEIQIPNFVFTKEEIIYIIGPSGSGKSTIIKGLAGFYPLATGEFLINNEKLDTSSLSWRETCSILPQEPELFPKTLKDNLSNIPNWEGNDEISEVTNTLFLNTTQGEITSVDIDNKGVSVGQRRIIALLRILGSDAEVLLLDEPIAGVDQKMVELLKPVFLEAIKKRKIIIIAMHQHDYERFRISSSKAIYLYL